ncbi:allophanate hydrolase [Phragmitibacter flavus]|uniref:allophanate hydrolase n=1 Tax=Phragmitibacter flavus TaxID=2576071 RepID=UPI00197DCF4E|nr:allophanate hydrolase [Phragmitibacter flavus]
MSTSLRIDSLLQAYKSGSTTPREIIEKLWQEIESSDPAIFISRPTWDKVDAFLRHLEHLTPAALPLYGIPFVIKDNIDQAGEPTTCACPAFEYTAEKSAFVVEQLIAAGAIPLGKTNLDQFATGLVGVRSPYGIPKNAYDGKYVPGGSSSGSAVALANGLCSFALGTDTAGSGRIPASLNNLVGMKPTRGVLSNTGLVPACKTLDCISIFALTTDDALKVYEVASTFDPADAYARPDIPIASKSVTDLIVGIPRADQLEFFGNSAAAALFDQSIERLKTMGIATKEVDLQPFLDAALLLYEGPWVAERYAGIEDLITTQPEALHPTTYKIISGGIKGTAVDAFRAQYKLAELRRASEVAWTEVDAIITPTAGTHYTVEEVLNNPVELNSNLGRYTNYMNLLDLAAWAVPAGFLEDSGMPWGVTFFAPAFTDRKLAVLASAFHAQTPLQ